jgi:hypothetical protein
MASQYGGDYIDMIHENGDIDDVVFLGPLLE